MPPQKVYDFRDRKMSNRKVSLIKVVSLHPIYLQRFTLVLTLGDWSNTRIKCLNSQETGGELLRKVNQKSEKPYSLALSRLLGYS